MLSFDKSIVKCYHCHKLGHFQYECPSKENTTNFDGTTRGHTSAEGKMHGSWTQTDSHMSGKKE